MAEGTRTLVRRALRSPAGGPVRLAHRSATAALVTYAQLADRRRHGLPGPEERAEVAGRVTVAAKTFERPAVARRMVRSARRVFDGRIVLADDSRHPMASPGPGVDVLPMPFNSGVSRGRNAALDAVGTELVLVTDDDIVFTAGTRIGRAMRYLDEQPDVDLVGFLRVELPRRYAFDHGADALFDGADPPLRPWGEEVGGLPVRLKVEQVYLARTDAVQRVRWDEDIRMVDHKDFFTRASGRLVAVLDHGIVAYHARPPYDAAYTSFREDVAEDLAYLGRKWRG